jgi:predicted O-methyltransferase YrrM
MMTDGPMIDKSGLYFAFLGMLPEPVRNFYRTHTPKRLRQRVREIYPYEQDIERTFRFWANPIERRRRKAALDRCRYPQDYFDFATKYLGHQQWKQEITGFLNFAIEERPVRICELGLFNGGTNLMLTHAITTVRQVVGVDMHVRNESQLRYFAKPYHEQIYIKGMSCDAATLMKVGQALGSEKFDLLFIDADHSYSGVKQDFLNYKHFVRDGGIIAFHDIVQDHLTKFKRDPASWEGASSGEVYLFWQRLKHLYEKTREFVIDYEQDGCGIGALLYSSKVDIPADL